MIYTLHVIKAETNKELFEYVVKTVGLNAKNVVKISPRTNLTRDETEALAKKFKVKQIKVHNIQSGRVKTTFL